MNQLRPYQQELLEQVRAAYRQGYRSPCIVLPCGGGKSVIVAEMAKRTAAKGNRALFLVHRRELCDQIKRTFYSWGVDMSLCEVNMVQTASRRVSRMPEPSLIITDENHHCLAGGYRKIYDAFPHARRVGVTATPIRLNGGGLGDVNDLLIEGPDARWLIENDFLAPYDYYAPKLVDDSGLKTSRGEFDLRGLEISRKVYGDAVGHYQKLADGKQAVCYCSSIEHSQRMAAEFSGAGIPAAHIDGETPRYTRDRLVSQFRAGSIRILCNVDLISEGFDVPDCGACILLRPTKSLTLFIQQSMRCMRYQPGKRAVVIDHVGNCMRFGLPDDRREWELAPKKKKKSGPGECPVRQCPKCWFTFPAVRTACPMCGYQFPAPKRELEEIREAALEKFMGFTLDFSGPEQCQNLQQLQAYGKARGFKPGWAWHQAKRLGMVP